MHAFGLFLACWARYIVLWFFLLLPLSPSVWGLHRAGQSCFTDTPAVVGADPVSCLGMIAMVAPFAVIFGPIAHYEEDPPSVLPEVLLTAFLLPVVATAPSAVMVSLRRKKP